MKNLVSFYSGWIEEASQLAVLITEFCPGESLAAIFQNKCAKKQSFSEKGILDIANGILKGLHFLHKNKMFHGNLTMNNVLFDELGAPKLSDFGIVQLWQEKKLPEMQRVKSEQENQFASEEKRKYDIHSLGLILYKLCLLDDFFPESYENQVSNLNNCNMKNQFFLQIPNMLNSNFKLRPDSNSLLNCCSKVLLELHINQVLYSILSN